MDKQNNIIDDSNDKSIRDIFNKGKHFQMPMLRENIMINGKIEQRWVTDTEMKHRREQVLKERNNNL